MRSLVVVLALAALVEHARAIPSLDPICAGDQYMDYSKLECEFCRSGETPDYSVVDYLGNALECTCSAGRYAADRNDPDNNGLDLDNYCMQDGFRGPNTDDCVAFTCVLCSEPDHGRLAATDDREACMDCPVNGPFDDTTSDCECWQPPQGSTDDEQLMPDGEACEQQEHCAFDPENCYTTCGDYRLVEYDEMTGLLFDDMTKTCEQCPLGTFVVETDGRILGGVSYKRDLYTCQSCPDPNMEYNYQTSTCECVDLYEKRGEVSYGEAEYCVLYPDCIELTGGDNCYDLSYGTETTTVEFRSIQSTTAGAADETDSVESLTIEHYYAQCRDECWLYDGPHDLAACQCLANICVMHMYDRESGPCTDFLEIELERDNNQHSELSATWKETLPMLYYEEGEATSIREDTGIDMLMSFSEYNTEAYAEMKFKISKFSLNGTWIGLFDLDTQFFYCGMSSPNTHLGGGTSGTTQWLRFGHTTTVEFECDLETLIGEENFFYDLYLVDQASDSLYPVPVLIKNYEDNGERINENLYEYDFEDDQFVNRFSLFDTTASITSNSEVDEDGNLIPTIVRYASKITMYTSIQLAQTEEIFPPELKIEYRERKYSDFYTAGKAEAEAMKFDTVTLKVEYGMQTTDFWQTVEAFFGVTMTFVLIIFLWRMRNHNMRTNRPLAQGSTQQGGAGFEYVAHMIVLLAHTFTVLFFFFITLTCFYWFTFFKMQDVVYVMLPRDDDDLYVANEYYPFESMLNSLWFFQTLRIIFLIRQQTQCEVFFIDWEKERQGEAGSSLPVSVWRTVFVANEWNEMQTMRKTSCSFTLFWLMFLLVGCDLQYCATPQPDPWNLEAGQLNPVLRYANTTFWWGLLWGAQRIWQFTVFERWFSQPRGQLFVDLCTMAKVSVMVLDERYHGWYLHCRSPYEHADAPMSELHKQLRNEEADLVSDRSLEGCDAKDVQTFEIHVTDAMRSKYDEIYASLVSGSAAKQARMTGRLGGMQDARRGGGRAVPSQRQMDASSRLNSFIKQFVEQQFREDGLKRHFQDKTWSDKILDNPPDMRMAQNMNIFHPEHNIQDPGYLQALFLGIEYDLLLYNVLCFATFDLWFENTTLTIFLVYLLEQLLKRVRAYYGVRNLSDKTLVDDRFLI